MVRHPTLAWVVISQFVSSSPMLGSVLIAQSLEPASDSVSPSLSAPLPLTLCLSKTNIEKKLKVRKRRKKYGGFKSHTGYRDYLNIKP